MVLFRLLLPLSLLTLASCTIPDQRDVTHLDLVDIINNIRCETRDALQAYPPFRRKDHVIAFGFDFNSEIHTNITGTATLTWPLLRGVFSTGFDASKDKKRYGDERVTIAETFTELRGFDCERIRSIRVLSYPIVGRIGVDSVIAKYLDLVAIPTADVKDFSRTLRFTLRLGAGATPQWDVSPAIVKVKAQLDMGIDRQDFHEVKIVITPVPRKKTAAELLAEKTVYVRILGEGPTDRRSRSEELQREPGAGQIPLPSAAELAKRRAIDQVRDGRLNDTYKQIERQLGPVR